MALANDNFYGYAFKLLVEKRITWLECAAASLVWTTIMVYYVEAPYGHLMLESMEGAQERTHARGNLFSFSLPWDDIERRCAESQADWATALEAAQQNATLPHCEDVLASLVNVHIIGGSKDLVECLEGATLRTGVVLQLISELRDSGHPGYTAAFNSDEAVRERMHQMYTVKYDRGSSEPFVPELVRKAAEEAHRAKLHGTSLIYDKNATPAEPLDDVTKMERQLRPLNLVAQRSSKASSTVYEEHGNILARYQQLDITTGSTMLDQYLPQYLGYAHPFTMPVAAGGYDVKGKRRWRRPDICQLWDDEGQPIDRLTLQEPYLQDQPQVAAAKVKLFDLTRTMPRRIEAQYRRHWAYVPGLWNLYFREQVNFGASLGAISRGGAALPQDQIEQDAAMAAADMYEKLHSGTYLTQTGQRRQIAGDMSKLRFAIGVTPQQKRLLADFSFRTRTISGTQEIRTRIGHLCFWSSVVYGNGIFMTISPGERHNYLAIRLSRYRRLDPYITGSQEGASESSWIGNQDPRLQAASDDLFDIEVPGYDMRRLLLARDPLAAVLAFAVQVRGVLAPLFGIRMCPDCPHCSESDNPCQDAFGSNAEAMGGLAGRSDGIAGAVECQKKSGSLHLHFWNFIQRAHQHKSLVQIAALIEASLISAADMKQFCSTLCCEAYPDDTSMDKDTADVEKRWPQFHEDDEKKSGEGVPWGDHRFGRLPPFLWEDRGITRSSIVTTDKRMAWKKCTRALYEKASSTKARSTKLSKKT